MVHDWGSRDATFISINQSVLTSLVEIIGGGSDFVTVPMQGSGTFAVEAMLTTFVPRDGKVLLLINGAYGQRAKKICDIARRAVDGARDAGGHAAGSRRDRSAAARTIPRSRTSSRFTARRRPAFSIRSARSARSPRATASAS